MFFLVDEVFSTKFSFNFNSFRTVSPSKIVCEKFQLEIALLRMSLSREILMK